MEHINGFKAAVAAVLGGLTALWGWFGWLVLAWLLCMALDYGTGTAAARQCYLKGMPDEGRPGQFVQYDDSQCHPYAFSFCQRRNCGIGREKNKNYR